MSDIRKPKNPTAGKSQVSKNQESKYQGTKPALDELRIETQVNAWSILGRAVIVAAIVFFTGMAMTLIASWAYNFQDLPHRGEIQYSGANKVPSFYAYYPSLRKFAITEDPTQAGSESQFTKIGTVGTGFFVYVVINAFHWVMEIGFSSLGGMVLIPIMVLIVGSAIFYFKMLPRSMQKLENALTAGIGIAMLHALIVIVFFLIALQLIPTFNTIFHPPYFYSGDVLMSTIRAGIPILIMTSFAYGSIAGGILYLLAWMRAVLHSEHSGHLIHT